LILLHSAPFGAAAGGIISSAADMGKYLAFHLTKGKNSNGDQVVPEVFHDDKALRSDFYN